MEEFFLRLLLTGKELYVVDQDDVGAAVAIAKYIDAFVLDRPDEFIRKRLARDVDDVALRLRLHYIIG